MWNTHIDVSLKPVCSSLIHGYAGKWHVKSFPFPFPLALLCWSWCWVTVGYPKQQVRSSLWHRIIRYWSHCLGDKTPFVPYLYCFCYQNTYNITGSIPVMVLFMAEKRDLINLLALGAVHRSVSLTRGGMRKAQREASAIILAFYRHPISPWLDADICVRDWIVVQVVTLTQARVRHTQMWRLSSSFVIDCRALSAASTDPLSDWPERTWWLQSKHTWMSARQLQIWKYQHVG